MQTVRNVVSTLVRCSAEGAGGAALRAALDVLQRPELLAVSRDDYFVYLTPAGHLYDKSVVPGYRLPCIFIQLKTCTHTYVQTRTSSYMQAHMYTFKIAHICTRTHTSIKARIHMYNHASTQLKFLNMLICIYNLI